MNRIYRTYRISMIDCVYSALKRTRQDPTAIAQACLIKVSCYKGNPFGSFHIRASLVDWSGCLLEIPNTPWIRLIPLLGFLFPFFSFFLFFFLSHKEGPNKKREMAASSQQIVLLFFTYRTMTIFTFLPFRFQII